MYVVCILYDGYLILAVLIPRHFFFGSGNVKIDKERILDTGKSLSEALIFASTKPNYDDKLLIEFLAK